MGPNRSEAKVPEQSGIPFPAPVPLMRQNIATICQHPACETYYIALWHHSQVVRQRSAKPLFPSPSLGGASNNCRSGGMVDARDLKSLGGNSVRVRVPPSAPISGTDTSQGQAFIREFRICCERSVCPLAVPPFVKQSKYKAGRIMRSNKVEPRRQSSLCV